MTAFYFCLMYQTDLTKEEIHFLVNNKEKELELKI
jgi:hypothetical protein